MSTLRLHNSLTRRIEEFIPQDPRRVTLYVCGPTVYNYVHIGNARPYVVFSLLARFLAQHEQVGGLDDAMGDAFTVGHVEGAWGLAQARDHLGDVTRAATWEELAQGLLLANEFVFVD